MNNNIIIVVRFTFQIINTISDSFLSSASAKSNPLQLIDIELPRISPHNTIPTINAYNFNHINLWMPLKTLQCINENRFIIYIDKLLSRILSHSMTRASGDNNCNVHFLFLQCLSMFYHKIFTRHIHLKKNCEHKQHRKSLFNPRILLCR